MRLGALILIAALAGPSAAALACEWLCAAKHQASVRADSDCHDAGAPGSSRAWATGFDCHQPGEPAASVLTNAAQTTVTPATVEDAPARAVGAPVHFATRRPDRSHAPPPSLPVQLRV